MPDASLVAVRVGVVGLAQAGPVDADAFRLKHWQLQGSSDGLDWVVLHNHDRYATYFSFLLKIERSAFEA